MSSILSRKVNYENPASKGSLKYYYILFLFKQPSTFLKAMSVLDNTILQFHT